MNIRLSYLCDEPLQVVTITLTETDDTDKHGCKVKVTSDPPLQPGTPNPYDVLQKFLSVLDNFELPVRTENAIDNA